VERYAAAVEQGDVDRIVELLTDDALMTMPPQPLEVHGPAAIAEFFEERAWWGEGLAHLVPTRANGQPAFAMYLRDPDGHAARAHGVVVLTLQDGRISRITRFEPSLFATFGAPGSVEPGADG